MDFTGTLNRFGLINAGEFSVRLLTHFKLAINDCGRFLNGVNLGQRYDGTYTEETAEAIGSCDRWNNFQGK